MSNQATPRGPPTETNSLLDLLEQGRQDGNSRRRKILGMTPCVFGVVVLVIVAIIAAGAVAGVVASSSSSAAGVTGSFHAAASSTVSTATQAARSLSSTTSAAPSFSVSSSSAPSSSASPADTAAASTIASTSSPASSAVPSTASQSQQQAPSSTARVPDQLKSSTARSSDDDKPASTASHGSESVTVVTASPAKSTGSQKDDEKDSTASNGNEKDSTASNGNEKGSTASNGNAATSSGSAASHCPTKMGKAGPWEPLNIVVLEESAIGKTATAECRYLMNLRYFGTASCKCGDDAQWQCDPCVEGCAASENAQSANGVSLGASWPGTALGSTATLQCPAGYTGSVTRKCSNGMSPNVNQWQDVQGDCIKSGSDSQQTCPEDTTEIVRAGYSWPKTAVGQTATLDCGVIGLTSKYVGTVSRTCGAGGVWGSITQDCALRCRATTEEAVSENGVKLGQVWPNTEWSATASLPCPKGYSGTVTRQCTDHWENVSGTCVAQ